MRKTVTGRRPRPRDRAAAVARIQAGTSTVEEEARRYGVSPRAVRAWVAGVKTAQVQAAGVPPPATPAPAQAAPVEPPLDPEGYARAKAALGDEAPPTEEATAETPAETPETAEADEAVDLVRDFKQDIIAGLVEFRYSEQLSPDDPAVQRAAEPGALVRRAARRNAWWVGGMANLLTGNPIGFFFSLGLDLLRSFVRVKRAARAAGWTPPAPPPSQEDEVQTYDAPPVAEASPAEASGTPEPAPPPEEEERAKTRIVDAPVGPPANGTFEPTE